MGRDEYNRSINMVIVCPITMTSKNHPFLVPIRSEKLPEKSKSKVNTNQVYSLDYTEAANRKIQFVENMKEEFYQIAQKFMHNFAFKL